MLSGSLCNSNNESPLDLVFSDNLIGSCKTDLRIGSETSKKDRAGYNQHKRET